MSARLYRVAMVVVGVDVVAIVSGAWVTSSRIALSRSQGVGFHEGLGVAAVLWALVLCLGDVRRRAGWLVLAIVALAALTGWPSLHGVGHAIFAHLSLGCATAGAVLSSAGWAKTGDRVELGSWAALRPAAIATPAAVMLQISLGALYRHEVIGVMPHMLGAMVVALLTLVVSTVLLQQFSFQRQLKNAATVLISVVLAQVCLGIVAFLMRLMNFNTSQAFAWTATAHVAVGALTLAASVVTAMLVARFCADDTRDGRSTQSSGPST